MVLFAISMEFNEDFLIAIAQLSPLKRTSGHESNQLNVFQFEFE